ncbi:MAG: anthrone oxygenase family protein [Myxococcota bacterium]
MSPWLLGATAVACLVVGGIFYGFSSFIMPALGRIPAEEGIHAMQRINVDVYHWTFMAAFMGTPLACIAIAVQAIRGSLDQAAVYALAGCLVYVVGNFVVTAAGNVPLNKALALVDPGSADAVQTWSHYLVYWTRWNHVRTAASIVAAALLLVALRLG